MVGNPWQSKACVTCRKRKVKCDLQEPECGNCLKRGIKCQGYLKDRIFIHQTAQSMTIAKSRGGLNRHSVTQLQFCLRAQPISLSPVNAVVDSGPMKREQLFSSYFTVYFPPDIRGKHRYRPMVYYDLRHHGTPEQDRDVGKCSICTGLHTPWETKQG
ncbi:hypothetical protein N7462_002255 [Penicillium macrosclerotiorum]|uniref:uncharacterized protein n=1 Tax=Penicillium macrosclerotiorum TaxID=303699 RepID=UPI002548A49A|nr:uncharacterized protein N7462_002255 [Penicillium macrosclerotiorum]KAJ5692832.1 hypothetical protein N7462_002255 [Penicillium macrosclerotiorum]